jgi:hypothetical protein
MSLPSAKSRVMSAMAYLAVERSITPCGTPSSSISSGEMTRDSTSSGVIPGALRISLTWVGEMSG